MSEERIVIVAGPSRGKSTLAHKMHTATNVPVYCGDPPSKVVFKKPYTHYLPENLDFAGDNGAAQWVAGNWFPMPGPWVCEGHVMARALHRWMRMAVNDCGDGGQTDMDSFPCDRIIVLDMPAHRNTSTRQEAMHKGVMTVWDKVRDYYEAITEYRYEPITESRT